jgi:hypothetical protein
MIAVILPSILVLSAAITLPLLGWRVFVLHALVTRGRCDAARVRDSADDRLRSVHPRL